LQITPVARPYLDGLLAAAEHVPDDRQHCKDAAPADAVHLTILKAVAALRRGFDPGSGQTIKV
jgi:hypothetical protein